MVGKMHDMRWPSQCRPIARFRLVVGPWCWIYVFVIPRPAFSWGYLKKLCQHCRCGRFLMMIEEAFHHVISVPHDVEDARGDVSPLPTLVRSAYENRQSEYSLFFIKAPRANQKVSQYSVVGV